jgi:Ni,Fe-hydrogenase maturation factor
MRHPRLIRLACLLLLLAACAHWQAQTQPTPDIVGTQPKQLLVTRRDSSTVILVDPVVVDSNLVGIYRTPRGKVRSDSTVHVPLSDIISAATWDPGSPVVFKAVPLGVLGLLVGFVVVCFATGCPST